MTIIQMLEANELISDSFQKINNNFSELNTAIENKTFDIDDALSLTSTNPVQNKVVTEALANVEVDTATNSEIDNALALAGTGTIPSGGVVSIAQGGTGATTATQARANLGAVAAGDLARVATSGNYNDLQNKSTIPSTANTKLTGTTTAETLTVTGTLNIPGGKIWIG